MKPKITVAIRFCPKSSNNQQMFIKVQTRCSSFSCFMTMDFQDYQITTLLHQVSHPPNFRITENGQKNDAIYALVKITTQLLRRPSEWISNKKLLSTHKQPSYKQLKLHLFN